MEINIFEIIAPFNSGCVCAEHDSAPWRQAEQSKPDIQ